MPSPAFKSKLRRAQRIAKRTEPLEDEIHIEVAARLKAAGVCFFHCPNGGSRNKAEAAKLKRMGVSAGVPDILITTPPNVEPYWLHYGAALEIKRKGGRVSKDQREWLARFAGVGWVTAVCYGLDECVEQLEEWGYL